MLQLEILITERLDTVDGSAPRAIAVKKVAALDHEVFNLGDTLCKSPTLPWK